ncbi:apolipoprotein A-II [Rhinophrynus dorsalis]
MKVLALVVLIIAVSGLEAGIVKREVPAIPNLDQLTAILRGWADTVKASTDELVAKIQNGELKAQAEDYIQQTKTQVQPLTSGFEKWFSDFIEDAKKKLS